MYDVFLSHTWADADMALARAIAAALSAEGLEVWFDETHVDDFTSITGNVNKGLLESKVLLAVYSIAYTKSRACQWELTTAYLAAQREGDPPRRILVANPEGRSSHIVPVGLKDAKYHSTPAGDPAAIATLVQAVKKRVASITVPLCDIHALTAPQWYGAAPVGSTNFVGRLAEMWEIHSSLHRGDAALVTGAPAATGNVGQISGMGGVGKSLLAEQYALRFGSAYPGGIFWLRAYGNDDAKAALTPEARGVERSDQIRAIADRLGIVTADQSPAQIRSILQHELYRRAKPCLWIVDDLPSELSSEEVRSWLFAPPARVLFTTRSREYKALFECLDLEVLPPSDAYQLLTSRRTPVGELEKIQAVSLAQKLGFHTLALDITASALATFAAEEPFASFIDRLSLPDQDAMGLAASLADVLPNGHERSLAKTFLTSIRRLGEEGKDFLRLASVLAVAPIPASLVTAVFQNVDRLTQTGATDRVSVAFRQVKDTSLADVSSSDFKARSVHALISHTVRFHEKAATQRKEALQAAVVLALIQDLSRTVENPVQHKAIESQVAHARHVVRALANAECAALTGWLARYDLIRGNFESAKSLFSYELTIRGRLPESQNRELVLIAMTNLAQTAFALGDLSGARQLQEETLKISQRLLGSDHQDTLTAMHNLAGTLSALGDLRGARELQEETLAARHSLLGPDHIDTLHSINGIALTLTAQGHLAEAQKLQEKLLETRSHLLGTEHPDTLIAMNNLALTLSARGSLVIARRLQESTLEIRRRVLGSEHPSTLTAINNLASTLVAQGDLREAKKLEEEAYEKRRVVLGPEHPETLQSLSNLALTLVSLGNVTAAKKMLEDVLDIRSRILGPEHPKTLVSMGNLAQTMFVQGDLKSAHLMQKDTASLMQRLHGAEHPETLAAKYNLAETLYALNDSAGARILHEQTLEIRRRVMGPEHPDTSLSAANLLSLLEPGPAQVLINRDLRWMISRDTASLSATQRQIREQLLEIL